MRIENKEIRIYTFEEASTELRQKIKEVCFCDGWQFEHCFEDRINTLKVLARNLNLELDYCLSYVPDRGEYITFKGNIDKNELKRLNKLDCPLTGYCYDHDAIEALLQNDMQKYIDSIHSEYESTLEDDYIMELCEANEYEFTENGKMY